MIFLGDMVKEGERKERKERVAIVVTATNKMKGIAGRESKEMHQRLENHAEYRTVILRLLYLQFSRA